MCMAGNLHLNVVAEVYSKEIEEALEPFVYELVGTSCFLPLQYVNLGLTAPLSSLPQGLHFCGTWCGVDEVARITLLEEQGEYRRHEACQKTLR